MALANNGILNGYSPAMEALPDLKMLQAMMLTTIKAAQKAADPPLFIPDDGIDVRQRTRIGREQAIEASVWFKVAAGLVGIMGFSWLGVRLIGGIL